MLPWFLASNDINKQKIYPRQCIQQHERNMYINWLSQIVLGFNLSEDIPNFNNHDMSESNIRCEISIRELWHNM